MGKLLAAQEEWLTILAAHNGEIFATFKGIILAAGYHFHAKLHLSEKSTKVLDDARQVMGSNKIHKTTYE